MVFNVTLNNISVIL